MLIRSRNAVIRSAVLQIRLVVSTYVLPNIDVIEPRWVRCGREKIKEPRRDRDHDGWDVPNVNVFLPFTFQL